MELWGLVVLFSAFSAALHIDTGYKRSEISTGKTNTHVPSKVENSIRRQDGDLGLPGENGRSPQNAHGRTESHSAGSQNILQRRGGSGRRKSIKRKQTTDDGSGASRSSPSIRNQRSGSSHHLSHSVSANSLGVEGGISKPQPSGPRIPRRGSGSQPGSQPGSFQSSELLRSLVNNQHPRGQGHQSMGDLQLLEAQRNFIGHQPALWNDRARSTGPTIPIQLHAFAAHQAFGGHIAPPAPLAGQNSNRSRKSDGAMSVDLSDTAQGPSKLRKYSAVNDLTMMDAWPPAGPGSGYTSSDGALSP